MELVGEGHVVRVHKVDARVGVQPGKRRRLLVRREAVPADLRHGERLVGRVRAEPPHDPREHAEALDARRLLGALEERLHAQAYPHVRPVGAHVLAQRLEEALLLEEGHGRAKATDAREDDHLRRAELLGPLDVDDRVPELGERVAHRAHVARPVVEEAHGQHGGAPRDRRCARGPCPLARDGGAFGDFKCRRRASDCSTSMDSASPMACTAC